MCNCCETHVLYQKGIPPTIPNDPIDHYKTYLVREKKTIIPFFDSLTAATAKKSTPTFCHWRPPPFISCHC